MMRWLLAVVVFLHALPAWAQGNDCANPNWVAAQSVNDVRVATNTQGVRLDPSTLFANGPDANALAAVLRGIADEPGEKGNLVVDVKAGGKLGTGAVNGSVSGNVNLEVSYSVTDQNQAILGFDAAAAVKAGINLAGLVEFGGKVEAGGSFIKLSFQDSASAAAWLTQQLNDINRRTGNQLWPAGSSTLPSNVTPPVVLTDRFIAGGVYAEGGLAGVELSGEGKVKRETRNYNGIMDGHAVNITQVTDHLIGGTTAKVPFNGSEVEVTYVYDRSTVSNSPFFYNNGTGSNHTITLKIPVVAGKKITSTTPGAPSQAAQDLILDTFGAIEKVAPAGTLANLNYQAFSAAVETAYDKASSTNQIGATTYLTLTLDISNSQEPDGSWATVYQRVLVGGEQHVAGQFNVKAVEVGVDVSVGKTENVYENLGTDTATYFRSQYLYQTADNPWSSFKSENASALQLFVGNVADPSHHLYDADVAAAVKQGGWEAGLSRLEQEWTAENDKVAGIRQDAVALAEVSNQWRWWNGDANMSREAADVLSRYPDRQMRQYLYDLVDDYGGKPEVITDLATGNSASAGRLRAWTQGLTLTNK